MSSSLDKLSSYLKNNKRCINKPHCNSDQELPLLIKIEVYP